MFTPTTLFTSTKNSRIISPLMNLNLPSNENLDILTDLNPFDACKSESPKRGSNNVGPLPPYNKESSYDMKATIHEHIEYGLHQERLLTGMK